MNHLYPLRVLGRLALLTVVVLALAETTHANTNFSKRLEAERATLQGKVEVSKERRGFTGKGYVDYLKEGAIVWTVNIPAPALYQLEFRYSVAGVNSNRPLNIFKNQFESVESNVSFPPTRNLDEWRTFAVFTKLAAGPNTIRLSTTGRSGPNVDHLVVSLTPPDQDKFLSFRLHSSHPVFAGSDADTAAYYKTVDPLDRKTTFDDWKRENDLTSCVPPDCIHTVYFNTVDLGFGRSLFLKVRSNGDVASYLQNYPSVRDALKNRNLLAAVAMEFGPPVDSSGQELAGPKFTKFYVFNAQGTRINKIDLDGRGEKFVPGLCNSCHGGKPKRVDEANQYFDRGETGAKFIAWDLDTFTYDKTLPRAMQEDEFKRLNQAVLLTNPPSATRLVIDGWYGGAGLPSPTFDGSFVPPGWRQDGAAVEELYRKVVAPSCRSCHNQRGSYNSAGHAILDGAKEQTLEFASFADFSRYEEQIESLVYEEGLMPLAKRTFDRFWRSEQPKILDDVFFGGLAYQNPSFEVYPGRARFAFGELRRPGRPIAKIAGSRLGFNSFPFPLFFMADVEDQRLKPTQLNGGPSVFASEFFWQIESGPGPAIPTLTGVNEPQASFTLSSASSDIRDPTSDPYLLRFGVTNEFADYNEIIRGQLFSDSALRPLTFRDHIHPVLTTNFPSSTGSTLSCIHCHSNSNIVSHADSIFRLRDFGSATDAVTYAYESLLTRVNCDDPENSLILKKPAADLPHFGGRINVFAGIHPHFVNPAIEDTRDDDAKAMILRWIMEGARLDNRTGCPAQ